MTTNNTISGLEEFMDDSPVTPSIGEVTTGDDIFQTAIKNRADNDFEYKLTAFVPKGVTPDSATGYPPEAAYWIIPDLNDVQIVRMVKIFELTFMPKIPAGYNELYLRVDRNNDPNPTELQAAIWDAVVARYKGNDGRATASQVYMLPVLVRREGQWQPLIGELNNTAYNEVKKVVATVDDASDGRINLRSRPIAIWRSGQKEVTARFDKTFGGNVEDLISNFKGEFPNPKQYCRTRAVATEKFLKSVWDQNQLTAPVAVVPMDAEQRYMEAVSDLGTATMRRLLKQNKFEVDGMNKVAMTDIMLENRDLLEQTVLSIDSI